MGNVLVKCALWFRWIPIVMIFLPLSVLLRCYRAYQRRAMYARLSHSLIEHTAKVRQVQCEVREKKRDLCSARPALFMTTMRHGTYKSKDNSVRLPLFDILELNVDKRTVRVEPMVTMADLSVFLNERSWTLPVLPELDDLTVGGLVSGYGVESSSHKYGLFMDTVSEVELVVADGELVVCRPEGPNADLFAAIGWSCGALGFIVSVTLRIIPASPYVRVRYQPLHSHDAIVEAVRTAAHSPEINEFVEAIVFGPDKGVLITGSFSGAVNGLAVNHLRKWNAEWFYKQLERMPSHEELIPLTDWYHRHTLSLFWEMELILPMGNSWLFRNLLGWMMPVSVSLLKLTHTRQLESFYEASHTAQDFLVPMERLSEALRKTDELFEIYPLWICPHLVKESPVGGAVRSRVPGVDEMFVDIGVYGVSQRLHRDDPWNARKAVAEFEQWLISKGGYSALYAMVELSRQDFERMFDRELHERMRAKWKARGVFRDTYDKIKRVGAAD